MNTFQLITYTSYLYRIIINSKYFPKASNVTQSSDISGFYQSFYLSPTLNMYLNDKINELSLNPQKTFNYQSLLKVGPILLDHFLHFYFCVVIVTRGLCICTFERITFIGSVYVLLGTFNILCFFQFRPQDTQRLSEILASIFEAGS